MREVEREREREREREEKEKERGRERDRQTEREVERENTHTHTHKTLYSVHAPMLHQAQPPQPSPPPKKKKNKQTKPCNTGPALEVCGAHGEEPVVWVPVHAQHCGADGRLDVLGHPPVVVVLVIAHRHEARPAANGKLGACRREVKRSR